MGLWDPNCGSSNSSWLLAAPNFTENVYRREQACLTEIDVIWDLRYYTSWSDIFFAIISLMLLVFFTLSWWIFLSVVIETNRIRSVFLATSTPLSDFVGSFSAKNVSVDSTLISRLLFSWNCATLIWISQGRRANCRTNLK